MTCNSNSLIYTPYKFSNQPSNHTSYCKLYDPPLNFGLILNMIWKSHGDHGCIHNWGIQKEKKIRCNIEPQLSLVVLWLIWWLTSYIVFYYYLGEYIAINIWLKIIIIFMIKKMSLNVLKHNSRTMFHAMQFYQKGII